MARPFIPNGQSAQRAVVNIMTVDPKRRLVEGVLQDGGKVTISVNETGVAFRWPKEGEIWNIERNGVTWKLATRSRINEDSKIEDIPPGELRLDSNVITDSDGLNVVATDASEYADGEVVTYQNGQWVPGTGGGGGGSITATYLDLKPFLQRYRYLDTVTNTYGYWGWFPQEYANSLANTTSTTEDDYGFCGLVRYGNFVQGIGSIYIQGFPYDKANRNRFIPAPLRNGTIEPWWQPGQTGYNLWMNSYDDNTRRHIVTTYIDSIWMANRETFEQSGISVTIPKKYRPWPSGHHMKIYTESFNSESWLKGLEFQVFFDLAGYSYCQQTLEGGGQFHYPSFATSGDSALPEDYRDCDGMGFDGLYIDLWQIQFYVYEDRPDPDTLVTIPWEN